MELSTSIPIPRAKPPNVIRFKVTPALNIMKNVAMTDTGIDMPITIVEPIFLRNRKIISTAKIPPTIPAVATLLIASVINSEESYTVIISK